MSGFRRGSVLAKINAAPIAGGYFQALIMGMSSMPDLTLILRPPYIFLILGVISILAAAIFTCTGRVWVRLNGWVYRAKEPGWFWWEVALYCLGGLWFVGYFLYKSYELSK